MTTDRNHRTYTSSSVVQYYAQSIDLQPAETTIINLLQSQLGQMKLLDIGVGGGRTTQHFANLVSEYIAIDYSPQMIAAANKRFPKFADTNAFQVCDVRDMSRFLDNSFDLILFSFNGIDYMSNEDRSQAIKEIQRVGKPGGYLFFSTHNLTAFEREFDFKQQISLNPFKTYINLVMSAFLHIFNYPTTYQKLRDSAYCILKDESHNFSLDTYYIRPKEQIDRLKSSFPQIKVYSWKTGSELTEAELDYHPDLWLYYLCKY